MSVFFGFGLVLLTWLQKTPTTQQGILTKFIFGNAATLMQKDLYCIALISCVVLMLLLLFWKEFKLLTFDPAYATSLGYRTTFLDMLLTSAMVLSIITGLQLVGVVLMSTILIAPAAAARQWTTHVGSMVVLAAFFGFVSCVTGSLLSSHIEQLPTGPTIVIVASIIVIISLIASPKRGLYQKIYKKRFARQQLCTCPDRISS